MKEGLVACRKCGEEKYRSEYHKREASTNGLHPHCKVCVKAYKSEYMSRPESKEKASAYRRRPEVKERVRQLKKPPSRNSLAKRREKRKTEEAREARREYLSRPEVRQRCLEQRKARYHDRHKHDISKKLDSRIRVTLRRSLKSGKNNRSWRSLVDFDIDQLRSHLERQFTDGMSWEAFCSGDIEIDHIVPVSSFNIDSHECLDFKACWSLANLRPLWKVENNKKRAKKIFLI